MVHPEASRGPGRVAGMVRRQRGARRGAGTDGEDSSKICSARLGMRLEPRRDLARRSGLKSGACFRFFACFFFSRGGEGGGRCTEGGSAAGARHGTRTPTGPPRAAPGGARRAPTGHPQIFLAELLGGRRQLGPLDGAWGPKIAPRGDVRKIRGSCCRVFSAQFRVRTRTGSPPSAGRRAGGVDGGR